MMQTKTKFKLKLATLHCTARRTLKQESKMVDVNDYGQDEGWDWILLQ